MSPEQLIVDAAVLASCVVIWVTAPACARWWVTMPMPQLFKRVSVDGWTFYSRSVAVVLAVLSLGTLPGGGVWSLAAAIAALSAAAWKYRQRG